MPQSVSDGALPWQRLAVVNKHERDDHISFVEDTHTYFIDGDSTGWVSCTKIVGACHSHFDADAIIAKMRSDPENFARGKYYGMTDEEIKAGWSANGAAASGAGTRMHLDIERFYNADPVGNLAGDDYEPALSPEWTMFLEYQRKIGSKFKPFRTEWLVWDRSVMISGSIDMVYRKPDGTLAIYDWKRVKEIKTANRYDNMLGPLNHLPDTNYWHYTMQLNVYRRIIEANYGEKVTELALVVLHPDNQTYQVLRLNLMPEEVDAVFAARRLAVEQGSAEPLVFD